MALDDVLDLGNGVPRHNQKTTRMLARPLVLLNGHEQPLFAPGLGALADDVKAVRVATGAEFRDPVVDLPEEDLVPGQPLLPRGHCAERTTPRFDGRPGGQPWLMDGSPGLSESERRDLLARIESLLGESPKGKLVREIVEGLPGIDDTTAETEARADVVPEAD